MFINDISPILVNFGPLQIRWYGLLFAIGLLLNFLILRWAFKREKFPLADLESIALYLFIGLIVGARLGEVLFYEPAYFLENPLDVFKIWQGGLSSHGAAIGVFLAVLLWSKVHKVKFSKYVDLIVLGMPVTAAFVRFGNFFNSEIVGKQTDSFFGVVFKRLGENFARHPAQLYEAFLSLAVFAAMIIIYKKYYGRLKPLFFLFFYILTYFLGRFFIEFFKDVNSLPESFVLNTGQFLSLIPVLLGIGYFAFYKRMHRKATH